MAQLRHQVGVGQQTQRSGLVDVDDDRVVGLALAQERDDAVVAGADRRADAVGAVDDERHVTPTIAPAVDMGDIGGPALVRPLREAWTRGRIRGRRCLSVQPLICMILATFLRLTRTPSTFFR